MMKTILRKSWLLLCAGFIISIFLNWLVYNKTGPNFPVIFRSNDFGINFLGSRNLLWQIPVLGIILVYINYWLSVSFHGSHKNLSNLLFFANIGVVILVFLISAQIYILNR